MKSSLFYKAMFDKVCSYIGKVDELEKEIERMKAMLYDQDDNFWVCEACDRYVSNGEERICDLCSTVYCDIEKYGCVSKYGKLGFLCKNCGWVCDNCGPIKNNECKNCYKIRESVLNV